MENTELDDARASAPVERLLEDSWESRSQRAGGRELAVESLAAAGFTFFTIDPSAFVQNAADHLKAAELQTAAEEVTRAGAFSSLSEVEALYLNRPHALSWTSFRR